MSAELDSLYQEIILDHYKNPHHKGLRDPFEAEVHHVNPTCGDEVTLRVHVADGVVADVSYDAVGCSISQASASMLSALVDELGEEADGDGMPRADVDARIEGFRTALRSRGTVPLDEETFADAAALSGVSKFTARVKCAMLAWVALEDALERA